MKCAAYERPLEMTVCRILETPMTTFCCICNKRLSWECYAMLGFSSRHQSIPASPGVSLFQVRPHPGRAASEKFCFEFCGDSRTGAQSITQDSQCRCVRGICQSNRRTGRCRRVGLGSHAREVTSVAAFPQRRLIGVTKVTHSFSSTDKIFPAGSLNHAMVGPPS